MNYDISKATAPSIPNLGRGTESVKVLLFWHQKSCTLPDFDAFPCTWCINERCGISVFLPQLRRIMWHNGQLDGKQWCNKCQLLHLVEAI